MLGDQFGGRSFTTIYKREQDKLANQFVAGQDLVAGMPVKLNNDGTVIPMPIANDRAYLGINMYNVKKGEVTTVMVLVSHVMVYAKAGGPIAPGDIVNITQVMGLDSVSDKEIGHYPHLEATTAPNGVGLALDTATNGTFEVRVLILDRSI